VSKLSGLIVARAWTCTCV